VGKRDINARSVYYEKEEKRVKKREWCMWQCHKRHSSRNRGV